MQFVVPPHVSGAVRSGCGAQAPPKSRKPPSGSTLPERPLRCDCSIFTENTRGGAGLRGAAGVEARGHAGKGDAAACERVMRDMQKAGLEPDVTTWSTLMNAHAGKGDAAACEQVMRDMQKAGLDCNRRRGAL
jgi:pentatricopeptide repeat protein